MSVEQHLVGLLRVGQEEEGAAAGQFEVSDLQLGCSPAILDSAVRRDISRIEK